MKIDLWLDDTRPAPPGWEHAKTAREAIDILKTQEVRRLELDHDLGHCSACTACKGYGSRCGCECHWTGMTVVIFMVNTGIWPQEEPRVHSQNPVGAANMRNAIERYWAIKELPAHKFPEGEEMGFRMSFSEQAKCQSFAAKHWSQHKNTELRRTTMFSYTFSPTGIGTTVEIQCCACKEAQNVTEYSSW